MKTYSLRIFPTKEQVNQLYELSIIRNDIWNTLISIQQTEYKEHNKILSKYDLTNKIPILKNTTTQYWNMLNSKAAQSISEQIFRSYQSFFNLIKKDPNARPPKKIDNISFFRTLVFNQSGWLFKENNIIKINQIPLEYKTQIKNIKDLNIKEIRVKLVNNKWLVDICVDDKPVFESNLNIETKILAIDLGLEKLGTGIDNYGNQIVIKNKARKVNKYFQTQISNIQQKRSKTKKGSKRNQFFKFKLNQLYNRKNSQVKQTLHIQSKKLVNMNYNTIIVGDLSVKQLMEIESNKFKKISKSFSQTNITMFLEFLKYKCQAKNQNLVKIDERNTTQLNCLTGKLFPEKIQLSQRTVKLNDKIEIDRDLNSAINIMNRWFDNHFASVNMPLDLSNVLSTLDRKPLYL